MDSNILFEKYLEYSKLYARREFDEGNNLFEKYKQYIKDNTTSSNLIQIIESIIISTDDIEYKISLSTAVNDLLYDKVGYEQTLDFLCNPNPNFQSSKRAYRGLLENVKKEEYEVYFSTHKLTKEIAAKIICGINLEKFLICFENIEYPKEFLDGSMSLNLDNELLDTIITHPNFYTKRWLSYAFNDHVLSKGQDGLSALNELTKMYPNVVSMFEEATLSVKLSTPTSDIEGTKMLSVMDSDSFIFSTTEQGKNKSQELFYSRRFSTLNKGLKNNIINLLISYNHDDSNSIRKAILEFEDDSFYMSPSVAAKLPQQYIELFKSSDVLNKLDITSKYNIVNGIEDGVTKESIELKKFILLETDLIKQTPPNMALYFNPIVEKLTLDEYKKLISLTSNRMTYMITTINPSYTEEELVEIIKNENLRYPLSFNCFVKCILSLNREKRNELLKDKSILTKFASYLSIDDANEILYEDIKDNKEFIDVAFVETISFIVDNYLKRTNDLELIKNKYLLQRTFGDDLDKLLSKVNLDDVISLIKKSQELSGDKKVTTNDIYSFISLVASLGNNAQEVLSYGKIDISVQDVINFKDKMLFYSMNKYRRENSEVLDNYYPNLLNALDTVNLEELRFRINMPKIITIIASSTNSNIFFDILTDIKKGIDRKSELYEICDEYKKSVIRNKEAKESKRILRVLVNNFEMTETGKKVLSDRIIKEHIIHDKKQVVLRELESDKISLSFTSEVSQLLASNKIGDFETFAILMMNPIVSDRGFEKEVYLSFFGYDKPKNYDYFLLNQRKNKTVNTSIASVKRAMNGLSSDVVRKALLYVTHNIDEFSENINPNILSLLQRERYALNGIKTNIDENDEVTYISQNNEFDSRECEEYQSKEFAVERLNKLIFKYINSVDIKEPNITFEELEKEIQDRQSELSLSEENFKIKKSNYSPNEVGNLFSGFNFTTFLQSGGKEKEIIEFLRRNNKIIKMLSSSLDDSYIPGIGVALSNFTRIQKVCEWFDINIEDLDIVDFKRIYDNISVSLNPYDLDIDRTVIRKICENDRFSCYPDPNDRMQRASSLMQRAIKIKSKSIPFVSSRNYETLDPHNPVVLTSGIDTDACFRIGGNAHNMLHYCVLDKNGTIVFLKDSFGKNVGRVFGVRRGNGLFLHQLQRFVDSNGVSDEELTNYLMKYSEDVIKTSSLSEQPIEFVSITDCREVKLNENNVELTRDKCPYIGFPIDEKSEDFITFMKTPGLKDDHIKPIYHNYGEAKTKIVCSTKNLEELVIKDYEALPLYLRKRKKAQTYDISNIEEYSEAKIKLEKILYLYGKDHDPLVLNIKDFSSITFGEDWMKGITNDGKEIVLELNYDERSMEELDKVRRDNDRSNSQVL